MRPAILVLLKRHVAAVLQRWATPESWWERISALLSAAAPWLLAWPVSRFIAYLIIGLSVTAAIEMLAVRSDWGWTYSQAMPLMPIINIGAVPVAMWIVVPTAALWMTRRMGAN